MGLVLAVATVGAVYWLVGPVSASISIGRSAGRKRGPPWVNKAKQLVAGPEMNSPYPDSAKLSVNEYITNEAGTAFLIQQSDGNLVLYRGSGPTDNRGLIWQSKGNVNAGYSDFQTILGNYGQMCTFALNWQGERIRNAWCMASSIPEAIKLRPKPFQLVIGTNHSLCIMDANNRVVACLYMPSTTSCIEIPGIGCIPVSL